MQTSFLLSNYAVREDVVLVDGGYFPAFSDDFFRREVKQQEQSLYSHIMDFDVLRLGKRIQKDNPRAGSFEYGVVLITEVGKERGNNLELRDVKKKDDAANQRNDGLNKWLKMARHSATVDYYPFIKVLTDEQRPESWGADCRDLCEIVRIEETGEQQLAMPFFTLASIFRDIVRHSYDKAASQFRFFRGDNTLFMTLFGSFAAAVERYYVRAVNRFGFRIMTLSTEAGTQDGQRKKIRYFQMRKKVFSDRYSTDCFSDYFREMSARALVGFGDYSSYRSSRASFEELRKQHSYFVNDILEKAETNAGEGFDKRQ